jgi:hypothetical protein
MAKQTDEVGGVKRFNDGKPELSYVLDFPVAMKGLTKVMTYGENKYGERRNWKLGRLTKEEYIDSLLRHLTEYQNGDKFDDDSKIDHLFHAMANMAMLAEKYGDLDGPILSESVSLDVDNWSMFGDEVIDDGTGA